MSESGLRAEHKGKGNWQVVDESGTVVSDGWLKRDEADKLVTDGLPKERPNRNKGRRERVSFGAMRSRLSLDPETEKRIKEMGKVPRWVNDDGNRLNELYGRGYDFLNANGKETIGDPDGGYQPPSEGTHLREYAGTNKRGEPMYAYLMVTDQESYDEDVRLKEDVNSMVDQAVKGGNAPGSGQTSENSNLGSTHVKDVKMSTKTYKP